MMKMVFVVLLVVFIFGDDSQVSSKNQEQMTAYEPKDCRKYHCRTHWCPKNCRCPGWFARITRTYTCYWP
ncbi:hypothetical protein MTO96_033122 [Rhipicephalus appendiculatus]